MNESLIACVLKEVDVDNVMQMLENLTEEEDLWVVLVDKNTMNDGIGACNVDNYEILVVEEDCDRNDSQVVVENIDEELLPKMIEFK